MTDYEEPDKGVPGYNAHVDNAMAAINRASDGIVLTGLTGAATMAIVGWNVARTKQRKAKRKAFETELAQPVTISVSEINESEVQHDY